MRTTGLLIAVALVVGACAKPLEVGSITEIKSNTGSRSIDVHEPRRAAGNTSLPEFAGDQLLEVRSYTWNDEKGQHEIDGAACQLSAADFSANLTTPAKVRVPLYRGQSSVLSVSCEKPGFQRKSITVAPIDFTRQQRYATSGGGGLIAVVAVAAIDAMSDNTKNEWRYPLARIDLEPAEKKAAAQ